MTNKQAALRKWNSMAAKFSESEIPEVQTDFTMKLICNNNMCFPNSSVLDVGCGTGKYAISLSRLGALVTCTDFSEKMIEEAKKCVLNHNASGIIFSQDDWSQIKISEKGWKNAFDIVLCSMTPAICDESSLKSAIDACRGWLIITKPCQRTSSVLDKLKNILQITNLEITTEEQIKDAFNILWDMEALPCISYDYQIWKIKRTLEEAIDYYINFLESSYGFLTTVQRSILNEYLKEIAIDGFIEEETHTTVCALYCNLTKIKENLL